MNRHVQGNYTVAAVPRSGPVHWETGRHAEPHVEMPACLVSHRRWPGQPGYGTLASLNLPKRPPAQCPAPL